VPPRRVIFPWTRLASIRITKRTGSPFPPFSLLPSFFPSFPLKGARNARVPFPRIAAMRSSALRGRQGGRRFEISQGVLRYLDSSFTGESAWSDYYVGANPNCAAAVRVPVMTQVHVRGLTFHAGLGRARKVNLRVQVSRLTRVSARVSARIRVRLKYSSTVKLYSSAVLLHSKGETLKSDMSKSPLTIVTDWTLVWREQSRREPLSLSLSLSLSVFQDTRVYLRRHNEVIESSIDDR